MNKLFACVFLALASVAASASTLVTFVGFNDDGKGPNSDNDYEDLIGMGAGIQLHDLGGAFANLTPAIALSNSGNPFWDNQSYDGLHDNFGDCLLGLGNGVCSTQVDATGLKYLALSGGGSVNEVWFTGQGVVTVLGGITADSDKLGVCADIGLGCIGPIDWISGSLNVNFGILPWEFVAFNGTTSSYSYSAPTIWQSSDFAFAQGVAAPEPGTIWLLIGGLALILCAKSRQNRKA